MTEKLSVPLDPDAELAAAVAEREARIGGPLPEHMVQALANLLKHDREGGALAWTGKVVNIPGGSPHMVMSRKGGAEVSIGPELTPENRTRNTWSAEELEEHRTRLRIDPNG